jgi:hypothetical protein
MRTLLALVLLGGCFSVGSGGGSTGGTRPGVMPMLSELPSDPTKRNAVLDSSAATAGPERRQGQTPKERKAETAAATAAAIIGGIFSKTQTVTIGTSSQFGGDDHPVAPAPPLATEPADGMPPPDASPADDPGTSNADLIPWIKLK